MRGIGTFCLKIQILVLHIKICNNSGYVLTVTITHNVENKEK